MKKHDDLTKTFPVIQPFYTTNLKAIAIAIVKFSNHFYHNKLSKILDDESIKNIIIRLQTFCPEQFS